MRWLYGAPALALCFAVLGAAPAEARAVQEACGWGSQVSIDTSNTLFIDEAATYWTARIPVPDGEQVELRGSYPHARYMSLAVYDSRLRTIDHLVDTDIAPDAGSSNPFLPGASRSETHRDFTLRIVDERLPASGRAANTLYMENADGSRSAREGGEAIFTLRIYAPDTGLDATGGVPLPAITVVHPSGERVGRPPCPGPAAEATSPAPGFSVPAGQGADPPVWDRFIPNGLGENVDNSYVYETFMPSLGQVLVLRARAPTFPATGDGESEMGTGDVRYWSMCTNLLTTAVLDCVHDEGVPIDDEGYYTIAISRPGARPANARSECGIAWLPADPDTDTVLVYRHMLPDADFPEAIQNSQPGTEEQTLGDYYPHGTYYDTVDYERRGCDRSDAAAQPAGARTAEPRTDRTDAPSWILPVTGSALCLGVIAAIAVRRRIRSNGTGED
jgi:hypothetical protein